jgi:hypothetical protein
MEGLALAGRDVDAEDAVSEAGFAEFEAAAETGENRRTQC